MTPAMPTGSGLLLRVAVAAVVGALIVVCVVMPAEYRKDPTGFGRMTGLLELTTPRAAAPVPEAAADAPAPPAKEARTYEKAPRTDVVKIPIGPDGELEYKALMKAGQSMIYSWEVDKGSVYFDFHGEAADPSKGQQYLEVQETKSSHGTFTAPFDGKHGWYWLNLTSDRIVVTLKLTGFYESHDYVK
jgi:hypothetical protein